MIAHRTVSVKLKKKSDSSSSRKKVLFTLRLWKSLWASLWPLMRIIHSPHRGISLVPSQIYFHYHLGNWKNEESPVDIVASRRDLFWPVITFLASLTVPSLRYVTLVSSLIKLRFITWSNAYFFFAHQHLIKVKLSRTRTTHWFSI